MKKQKKFQTLDGILFYHLKKNNIINKKNSFYFVHSYYAKPYDKQLILTNTSYYNLEFCSSVLKENILGCQFHPEKSGNEGIKLISNFFKNVR